MKKLIIAALMISGAALADKPAGKAAAKDKITGEVVDITCYASHGAKGEKHAACAQKCITAGNPVGLLVEDVVYLIVLSDHQPPGAKLAEFAGKEVVATGQVTLKSGMHVLDLDTVALRQNAAR
jgi:hypothetical protein